MKARGRRAFTLIEVLVAMAVMSILTLILARMASVAYKVGGEEVERSGVEASLLIASRRLEEDLLNAAPSGISIKADGSKLVIHPIEDVRGTGQVVFADKLILWSWNATAKRLTSSEILTSPKGAFDGLPQRLTAAQIDALPVDGSDRKLLELKGVTKFAITNPVGVVPPMVGSPLTTDIKLELPIAATRKDIELSRSVVLRTSGAY